MDNNSNRGNRGGRGAWLAFANQGTRRYQGVPITSNGRGGRDPNPRGGYRGRSGAGNLRGQPPRGPRGGGQRGMEQRGGPRGGGQRGGRGAQGSEGPHRESDRVTAEQSTPAAEEVDGDKHCLTCLDLGHEFWEDKCHSHSICVHCGEAGAFHRGQRCSIGSATGQYPTEERPRITADLEREQLARYHDAHGAATERIGYWQGRHQMLQGLVTQARGGGLSTNPAGGQQVVLATQQPPAGGSVPGTAGHPPPGQGKNVLRNQKRRARAKLAKASQRGEMDTDGDQQMDDEVADAEGSGDEDGDGEKGGECGEDAPRNGQPDDEEGDGLAVTTPAKEGEDSKEASAAEGGEESAPAVAATEFVLPDRTRPVPDRVPSRRASETSVISFDSLPPQEPGAPADNDARRRGAEEYVELLGL
ncbi:hypothetical protein LTR37_018649 [Vermiconidia calcicola]|uniref:Uncharacterized protein n=1 Tax=Vermiconidia calcicola TaxID=1690605 RepID=A0ACC3MGE4_9PEZI|nr:hypothetical protein LTR37_018649 [Vermiconidia calcicola]